MECFSHTGINTHSIKLRQHSISNLFRNCRQCTIQRTVYKEVFLPVCDMKTVLDLLVSRLDRVKFLTHGAYLD